MALRIKEIIKEKGMTVQTLADKMGIKTSAIYNKLSRSRKKLRNVFRSYKEGGIRE